MQRATIDRQFIQDWIAKTACSHADDLKKRYDMLFASGIVQKMHENNLLKEDVAAKLLNDGK